MAPNEIDATECVHSDALLDELDATIHQVGRLFTGRHAHVCGDGPDISGPRSLLLYLLAGDGPLRVSDVATQLGIKAPAASALVDSLVDAGLVERTPDPLDRRATLVATTAEGRAQLDKLEQRRRELMRRYCSVLTEADIRNLITAHHKLIDAMTAERI